MPPSPPRGRIWAEKGGDFMNNALENIDVKIALAWLAGQDLRECTPEEAKQKFFDAYYKIKDTNVERYD